MIKCLVCGKEFNDFKILSYHFRSVHKIKSKEYYDKYLKKENEEKCECCGAEVKFISIKEGYQKYCSRKCSTNSTVDLIKEIKLKKYGDENYLNKAKQRSTRIKNSVDKKAAQKAWKTRRDNIKKLEEEYNCTQVTKLIKEYGQGWLSLELPRIYLENFSFISDAHLKEIIEYSNENHYSNLTNKPESKLINLIESLGFEVTSNSYKIIPPLQIDIFIPELNLAVEYNGIYWHSKLNKDYHLNKSLMCRNKGIRLVHIYEFEDFNKQLYLLSELVKGNDLYNKKDFNKNNLLIDIPTPEIVYQNDWVKIFGAGVMYE